MQVRSNDFKSYKQLTDFFQRQLYLLHGQAFYRLSTDHHLTFQQIADCFGFTRANVNKAINLFLKNQQNQLDSPTLAQPDLGTGTANVPSSDSVDLTSLSKDAGQTTEREVIL